MRNLADLRENEEVIRPSKEAVERLLIALHEMREEKILRQQRKTRVRRFLYDLLRETLKF